MTGIEISEAAWRAIVATVPKGAVVFERQRGQRGGVVIQLPETIIGALNGLREPCEGYSEAIVRLCQIWEEANHVRNTAVQGRNQHDL